MGTEGVFNEGRPMTDNEIAQRIARECGVAVLLSLIGQRDKAQLFINHVLRVVVANKDAVERWMEARRLPEAHYLGKTSNGEQYIVPE